MIGTKKQVAFLENCELNSLERSGQQIIAEGSVLIRIFCRRCGLLSNAGLDGRLERFNCFFGVCLGHGQRQLVECIVVKEDSNACRAVSTPWWR